jgi:hypothetical protein
MWCCMFSESQNSEWIRPCHLQEHKLHHIYPPVQQPASQRRYRINKCTVTTNAWWETFSPSRCRLLSSSGTNTDWSPQLKKNGKSYQSIDLILFYLYWELPIWLNKSWLQVHEQWKSKTKFTFFMYMCNGELGLGIARFNTPAESTPASIKAAGSMLNLAQMLRSSAHLNAQQSRSPTTPRMATR